MDTYPLSFPSACLRTWAYDFACRLMYQEDASESKRWMIEVYVVDDGCLHRRTKFNICSQCMIHSIVSRVPALLHTSID